jgi:hypothetical protein
MKPLRDKVTYSNVVSTLCLFLLLGGGAAYAASQLGKNTVGTKQLKKNAVTTAKVKKEAITATKVKNGTLTGKQINASTLGIVPSAVHATSADNATQLGGLGANAYEHADQIKRFGPLEDATPGHEADGPTASFGPFSFQLFCQYGEGADVVSVASSEPNAVVTWTYPLDPGIVNWFNTDNLGSKAINMASSSKPGAYLKPVDGWALSPSGFQMHFSLWFGHGILGTDNSTCSFGGEFRRG